MIKLRNAAIYAGIILSAISGYIFFNSMSSDRRENFVELSSLSEADIDIIMEVKDQMKAAESNSPLEK